MYQHGTHWKDFRENSLFGTSRKSVEKLQIWLKSDRNIGHFTYRTKCISYC